ncbi:MAG TPA: TorF family putative porin [Pseudomonadales bacterium]|nr:TorF family putative porin [Pseudomonadales bacterium]
MRVKQLLACSVAASMLMAGSAAMATAEGKLSASATVSNMYLWRGIDLGQGAAAVSGDLIYSMAGAYGGIWMSSGDSSLGQEYDLFAGYNAKLGDVTVDLSLWNYNYSDLGGPDDTTGELSEVVLSVSAYGASVSVLDNVAGAPGYYYYTVGYGYDAFSAKLGIHSFDNDLNNMSHLDLSYAYNDNLSFTVSKVVDEEVEGTYDNDALFQVSYKLPIK